MRQEVNSFLIKNKPRPPQKKSEARKKKLAKYNN